MKAKFLLLCLLFTTFAIAQSTMEDIFYEREYTNMEAEELDKLRQQVGKLQKKAKRSKNDVEYIKALIYQCDLISHGINSTSQHYKKIIVAEKSGNIAGYFHFAKETENAAYPLKSVLLNLQAEMLEDLINRGRGRFVVPKNTRTYDDFKGMSKVHSLLLASLKDEQTRKTSAKAYHDLYAYNNQVFHKNYLYDYLMTSALRGQFYKDSKKKTGAILINPIILAPLDEFVAADLGELRDTSSYLTRLKLYQDWLRFHQTTGDKNALIHVDLGRIKYANYIFLGTYAAKYKNIAHQYLIDNYPKEGAIVRVYEAKGNCCDKYAEELVEPCRQALKNKHDQFNNICDKILWDDKWGKIKIDFDNHYYPNQQNSVQLEYKNADSVYFEIFKDSINWEGFLVGDSDLFQTFQIKLPKAKTTQWQTTQLELPPLPYGTYTIHAFTSMEEPRTIHTHRFRVTQFNIQLSREKSGHFHALLSDAKTGKPVEGVTVAINPLTPRSRVLPGEVNKTDSNGELTFTHPYPHSYLNFLLRLEYKGEKFEIQDMSNNYSYRPRPWSFLLTDRSYYQPGEAVNFMGVTNSKNRLKIYMNEHVRHSNKPTPPRFKMNSMPDEHGFFSDSFQTEAVKDSGHYKILLMQNAAYHRAVHLVKPPKLAVLLNPARKHIKLGDSVEVSGKVSSFTNLSLLGLKIRYLVIVSSRTSAKPNSFYTTSDTLVQALTAVDGQGFFKITFQAATDSSSTAAAEHNYTINVIAEIEGFEAESMPSQIYLTVNQALKAEMKLGGLLPNHIPHLLNLKFTNSNQGNDWTDGTVTFKKDGAVFYRHDFFANEKKAIELDFKQWPLGDYEVQLAYDTKNGDTGRQNATFTLFDFINKRFPKEKPFWHYAPKKKLAIGDTLDIYFGAKKKGWFYFELYDDKKLLERTWLEGESLHKAIEVTEKHKGYLNYNITYFDAYKKHYVARKVEVPYDRRRIQIEFINFNKKMEVGKTTKLKLRLLGYDGKPVAGALFSKMYDAAFDDLSNVEWKAARRFDGTTIINDPRENMVTRHLGSVYKGRSLTSVSFDQAYRMGHYANLFYDFNYIKDWSSTPTYEFKGNDLLINPVEEPKPKAVKEPTIPISYGRRRQPSSPIHYRPSSVDESYFLPTVKTDKDGVMEIELTPKSQKKWRFMALAYTEDGRYSFIDEYIFTENPVNVIPNIPYKNEESKTLTFSTQLKNNTETLQNGQVSLELLDAKTKAPIASPPSKNFKVAVGGTLDFEWDIKLPEGAGAVIYRFSAKAGDVVDVEENLLR